MKLIIGLGNPGKEFEKTRHNAGFIITDHLQKNLECSNWNFNKKFSAEISEGKIENEKIILAKPQTFMNESGKSAQALAKFYKTKLSDIIVIHDDTDLPLGRIKIKSGGSSAGHKGIESISNFCGQDFIRIRIGVAKSDKHISAGKIVLSKFTAAEFKKINLLAKKIELVVQMILGNGVETAMSLYNNPNS